MQTQNNYNNFFNIKKIFENLDLNETFLYKEGQELQVVFITNNEFKTIKFTDFFKLYYKYNKDFNKFIKEEAEKEKVKAEQFLQEFILNYKATKKIHKNLTFAFNILNSKKEILELEDELKLIYCNLSILNKKQLQQVIKEYADLDTLNVKEYKKYITLFKEEHFEELDDMLNFIILNLFNNNRKQSFFYIVARSNWGKTQFFAELIQKLNIGNIVVMDALLSSPTPYTANDFIQKAAIFIDEFTVFKKELKLMDNTINLNTKNEKIKKIEVFAKFLLSKEQSSSISDVVDEQIQNRLLILNKQNAAEIGEFLAANNIDGNKLKAYLLIYYYNKITKKIKYFKRLKYAARNAKIQQLADYFNKNYSLKQQNTLTTEQYIKQTFTIFIQNFINKENDEGTIEFEFDKDNYTMYYKKLDNNTYKISINKFNKLLAKILEAEDADIYKSVKYSLNNTNIFKFLEKNKVKRINNKLYKVTTFILNLNLKDAKEEQTLLDKKLKEIAELKQQLQQKNTEIEQLKTQIAFLEQQKRQLKVDNTITTLTKKQVQEIPHIHIEEELPF